MIKFLMGVLEKFIGLGPWAYVLVSVVSVGGGVISGYQLKSTFDQPVISKAQALQAQAEKATADKTAEFERYARQAEKDRADAAELARTQAEAQSREIVSLRSQLTTREIARRRASDALLESLRHVNQADTSPLGAGAKSYYDSVRRSQAPDGHPATGTTP